MTDTYRIEPTEILRTSWSEITHLVRDGSQRKKPLLTISVFSALYLLVLVFFHHSLFASLFEVVLLVSSHLFMAAGIYFLLRLRRAVKFVQTRGTSVNPAIPPSAVMAVLLAGCINLVSLLQGLLSAALAS